MHQLKLGQVVKSIAGRDKGRYMLIVGIIDENYVYVADGDLRKAERPKKKKIKHLKFLNMEADFISEKLRKKRKLYNDEIKEALKKLVDTCQDGGI